MNLPCADAVAEDSSITWQRLCLGAAGLLTVTASGILMWRLVSLLRQLRSYTPKGRGITWRNKYPSLEDMHALFDRGDALMAAVLVATTLQVAHSEVAKVLETHSMYKTDPWKRLVRTLTFIHITVRANSAQRSQIVVWLNKLHGNIRLFEFKTNTFILATIAYGLARAHQVLGCVNDIEVDAMVSAIMNMANKINPKDRHKTVPTSLTEVEEYLSKQINMNPVYLQNLYETTVAQVGDVRKSKSCRINTETFFQKPLSYMKLFLLVNLFRGMTLRILAPFTSSDSGSIPGLLLSFARTFQPLWYHLHYSACPRVLTLDGFFDLLVKCDPSLKNVVDDVYHEIFGADTATMTTQSGLGRKMTAHLPQLKQSQTGPAPQPELMPLSFYGAVTEHVKCAYLRAKLASSGKPVPQHLGVIMDGNRRYSRENGLGSVMEGHRVGARRLLQFMAWSFSVGINNLTVWALSDDNLKRGKEELEPLFTMMSDFIREILMGDTPIALLEVRFRVVGDRSLLPEKLNQVIDAAEKATEKNKLFNMQLALGYGGRSEVVRAVKRAVKGRVLEQSITLDEALSNLTAKDISRHIYSAELGLPPMDAVLRTSGENRTSGFALWEAHAAELAFVTPNWPGMSQSAFLESIVSLSERNRRYGA